MATQSFFRIENDSPNTVILYVEPEGAAFPLGAGEEVSVFDVYTKSPVTLRLSKSDEGDTCVSIWPGDGEVKVEKGGVNVFDLLQRGVGVGSPLAFQQPQVAPAPKPAL